MPDMFPTKEGNNKKRVVRTTLPACRKKESSRLYFDSSIGFRCHFVKITSRTERILDKPVLLPKLVMNITVTVTLGITRIYTHKDIFTSAATGTNENRIADIY